MRSIVVFFTLALTFIAPLAISTAEAAQAGTVKAQNTDCRRRRAKKPQGETKPKKKDGKKPYGFEL
jgi:hypothetical protein